MTTNIQQCWDSIPKDVVHAPNQHSIQSPFSPKARIHGSWNQGVKMRVGPFIVPLVIHLQNGGDNSTHLLGFLCPHEKKPESFVIIVLLLLFLNGPLQNLCGWFSWLSAVWEHLLSGRAKRPASDLELPLILHKTPHEPFPPSFISSLNLTLEQWIYEFMNINRKDMPFIIFLTLSNGSAKYCLQMHKRYTSCLIRDKLWVTGFYCSVHIIYSFNNIIIIINHHEDCDRSWR